MQLPVFQAVWRPAVAALLQLGGCGPGVSGDASSTDAAPAPGPPPPARANVVLIVVDTLRADHLSQYGYGRATGPGLERLARDAVRFTNAHAPTGWTAPSVASIFTGQLPPRHGLERIGEKLPTEVTTLAELLHDHGWQTAGHSFNHLVTRTTNFQQGFAVFEHHTGVVSAYQDVAEMVGRAELWARNGPQPFFLYLQPMNVHGPYKVPMLAQEVLLGRAPDRTFDHGGELMDVILVEGDLAARERVTEAHVESLVEQYDAAIRYTFDELGQLLDTLVELDLYDESLIVLTADHGEELFDHGGFSHGYSLHRELTEVPLFVKLPGAHDGGEVDALVSLVDLYPTVADALGVEIDRLEIDGRSLLPLLAGGTAGFEGRALVQAIAWEGRCVGRALTTDSHRLIEVEESYEGLRDEVLLFDRAADPEERVDLSQRQPELTERLQEELDVRIEALEEPAGLAERVLDQMDIETLRALGYAE